MGGGGFSRAEEELLAAVLPYAKAFCARGGSVGGEGAVGAGQVHARGRSASTRRRSPLTQNSTSQG